MSRIPPDDTIVLPPYDSLDNEAMADLFRIMAHRPAIMQQAARLLETTMREGTVEPQLKELLAVRVSQINDCAY